MCVGTLAPPLYFPLSLLPLSCLFPPPPPPPPPSLSLSLSLSRSLSLSLPGKRNAGSVGAPAPTTAGATGEGSSAGRKMASPVPELAKVEELRKALKLSGNEPAVQILGGVPRAFERFLIAHHNDIDSAAVAMRETLQFREEHKLDAAIAPSPRMAQIAKLWPGDRVCSSVDRSPVYFFGYGHYQPRQLIQEFTPEETTAYYLHFMDQMMRETNSANPSNASSANWIRPIEVHDMKGLTIRDHCIPAALAQLSRNIGLGQKHVPDNIRKAVFINAPLWFSMIWRLLKCAMPCAVVCSSVAPF